MTLRAGTRLSWSGAMKATCPGFGIAPAWPLAHMPAETLVDRQKLAEFKTKLPKG